MSKLYLIAQDNLVHNPSLVIDAEGKQLYTRKVDVNAEKNFDIDIRSFNQGVYISKVFNDKTSYIERLVKL